MKAWIKRVKLTFGYHLCELLRNSFFVFSSLFVIYEALVFFSDIQLKADKKITLFFLSVFVSFFIGLIRTIPSWKIRFRFKNCDTFVGVQFGDVFNTEGCIAIPVNEYFDTELGECVSEKSIHGQFIVRYFSDNGDTLRQMIESSLNGIQYDSIHRDKGNTKKYPLGTCATVKVINKNFILVALSRTNIVTFKASADIADLWSILSNLWKKTRECAGGNPLTLPLIGGGLSGVGFPPMQLLQLLLISLSKESGQQKITDEIRLIINDTLLSEIDLKTIGKEWK